MAVNPTAPATATPKGQHLVFHSIFSSPPSKFLWCTLPDWMMQHSYKHRAICREKSSYSSKYGFIQQMMLFADIIWQHLYNKSNQKLPS